MYFPLIMRIICVQSKKISIKKIMFFTLEGSEGVGKSTLIESLKDFFKENKIDFLLHENLAEQKKDKK